MRTTQSNRSMAMRMILLLLACGLAGVVTPATAADRIFADGFEPCCTLGGTVTGLTGSGFVLHLTAGIVSEDQPISAQGGQPRLYLFRNTAPPSTAYTVTITDQPSGQTCTLTHASGTIGSTPVDDIDAACVAGPAGLVWDDSPWDDANWQ